VLSRIAAALSEFVTPIASSSKKAPAAHPSTPTQLDFQRDPSQNPSHKKKQPQQPPDPLPPNVIKLDLHKKEVSAPPPNSGASAFIQIFTLFQQQKDSLLRWAGGKAYVSLTTIQERKRVSARKGAILDRKAE